MKNNWRTLTNGYTVESVLVAAASIHFDEIFGQNLLSKKWVLLRLLFEGGFYLRAASNTDDTVCSYKFLLDTYLSQTFNREQRILHLKFTM